MLKSIRENSVLFGRFHLTGSKKVSIENLEEFISNGELELNYPAYGLEHIDAFFLREYFVDSINRGYLHLELLYSACGKYLLPTSSDYLNKVNNEIKEKDLPNVVFK